MSHGSISNIINAYKSQHEQPSQLQPFTENLDINTAVNMSNTDSFSNNNTSNLQEIDFSDQSYDRLLDDSDYNETLEGESGEKLLNYTIESEQVVSDTQRVQSSASSIVGISDTQYDPHVSQEVKKIEKLIVEEPAKSDLNPDLGIDWDAGYQSRFVKWVFEEKKQRNYEKGMLRLHRKNLTREKEKLEKEKREFEAAESDLAQRITQVKDLIPMAAELKQSGLDFSLANSWLICVGEMAQRKGLDIRAAAWKLAEDLKTWQELGGLENAIQNAKNQLTLLNMTLEDQKAAIATLVNLQLAYF